MQKHTKIYLDFFEIQYDIATGFIDFVACTIQGTNCQNTALDIHHIDPRGMGGNPDLSRETIENYISGCRNCHDEAEAGLHSMQRLYDLQMAKILCHLQKKIDTIMENVLLVIKDFFKKYGTLYHSKTSDYYKIDLLGNVFVVWKCRTGLIVKLEGSDLFEHNMGFYNADELLVYCWHNQNKPLCTPEELTELHDEIKLIYQLNKN